MKVSKRAGYFILLENKSVFLFEIFGMIFIILLGSMLHFTFELSGFNPVVGIFSAVNESVWEHLKIAFWPALLYLFLEFRHVYRKSNNFFFAKAIGIYLIMLIIPVIFYSYTAFLEENLIIDIGSFVFAIIVGQYFSFRVLTHKKLIRAFELIGLISLILLAVAFAVFTFYPPEVDLFRDPLSGDYGIIHQDH